MSADELIQAWNEAHEPHGDCRGPSDPDYHDLADIIEVDDLDKSGNHHPDYETYEAAQKRLGAEPFSPGALQFIEETKDVPF